MKTQTNQTIGYITFLVKDYDEAIEYFTKKLNFILLEDTLINMNKRWVRVAPKGSKECSLLLAKASSYLQESTIGKQSGDRICFFLHTNNFWSDYNEMKNKGVLFLEEPRSEEYGTVVVFKDLYGNKWDLLELKQ